jgi:uncharacterized protein (DUF2147 family)
MARLKDTVLPVQAVPQTVRAPIAVTAASGTDRFAAATIPMVGAAGTFTATTLPGAIVAGRVYYVVQTRVGDFRVSETVGGAQVNITTNGSGVQFAPDGWVHFAPRSVASGYTELHMSVDRALLAGSDFGALLDVSVDLSLNGGATWGGTYTDPAEPGKQYSLELGMGVPDGQLIHRGVVVTESHFGGLLAPQQGATLRQARLRFRTHRARSWGFSLDLRSAEDGTIGQAA